MLGNDQLADGGSSKRKLSMGAVSAGLRWLEADTAV
jgi:hypothetical protein